MDEIKLPESKTVTLNKAMSVPTLNTAELTIANEYLAGKEIPEIADEFNISEERVVAVIGTKAVEKYIDVQISNSGNLHKAKLADYTSRMVAESMRQGTKKDPLEWIKLAMTLFHEKEKVPATQTNIQVNEVTKILKDVRDEIKGETING